MVNDMILQPQMTKCKIIVNNENKFLKTINI